METVVRRFTDERGYEVRLTDERLRHILRRHPEMAYQMHRFAETLAKPDAVRASKSNPTVELYYRLFPDLRGRSRYVCLVVKRGRGSSSILTGYLDRKNKGEQRRWSMTSSKVSVWYDDEGDMLEVLWSFKAGYFTPTDDERILKRLDDGGEVIGFLIHDMSTLKRPSPVEFELASETPADDVANVTVRQAAIELGVSDRRVRQLAREGRVTGAIKTGAEWLIPTPVEVIPGRRGPVGVAGRVETTSG